MHHTTILAALAAPLALAANLGTYHTNVTFPGPNPRNVGFNLYTPPTIKANAPVMVFAHWCHGSADIAYGYSLYPSIADQYGFPVIFPDSPNTVDKCWDVSSKATLTHNGGGDSQGIISMVQYVLEKYRGDPSRVFVSGISSGAMMTNVLLGAYPDVFARGAAFAGVPFGCFADPAGGYDVWNADCAAGKVQHSGAEWAQTIKAAYPGYNGYRPYIQIHHGTVDEVLNYQNFKEAIKMWTAVHGVSETPVNTTQNEPAAGITKTVYGAQGQVQAFSDLNVSHNIQNQEQYVSRWFDLACTGATCVRRISGRIGSRP